MAHDLYCSYHRLNHHSANHTSFEKPKIADCICLMLLIDIALRFIQNLSSRVFFWYCLASSSDQKKCDFRQKISTMLGSFVLAVFIKATQNMGSEPSSTLIIFRLPSSSIFIDFPLLAHSELTVKNNSSFRNLPYTKGAAIASTAQAAKNCSPVLTVIL